MLDLNELHIYFPLLNYYGLISDSKEERAARTLSKLDEYALIIRSLLILDVVADSSITDINAVKIIASGFPESEFGFTPLKKPENILPNLIYIRELLKGVDLKKIQLAYILHDITKCTAFVKDYALTTENAEYSAHDSYLDVFLAKNLYLKQLFHEHSLLVHILDLLGHSPNFLCPPEPVLTLDMIANIKILIYQFRVRVKIDNVEEDITNREAILSLLCERAELSGVTVDDIQTINPRNSFLELPNEIQNKLAYLMWLGTLRTSSFEDITEFMYTWNDPEYETVVSEMVRLLMLNLEQKEGYCALYNPGGLLYKNDPKLGIKGFLIEVEKGGMGAELKDIVPVFFPLILEMVQSPIERKIAKFGHNIFQARQLLELVKNLLPDLAEITQNENVYPQVNFCTPEMNQRLEERWFEHLRRLDTISNYKI